jgi:hypothetical protein
MKKRWKIGTPPKNGKQYEMKYVVALGGTQRTAWWSNPGWWDESQNGFVERNQFTGGLRHIVPAPNRWREHSTSAQQNAAPDRLPRIATKNKVS